MGQQKCSVEGCTGPGHLDPIYHRYPNPLKFKERYLIWARASGPAIESLSPKFVYKSRRICDKHFDDRFRLRLKRLNILAVPTLHVPVPPSFVSFRPIVSPPPSEDIPGVPKWIGPQPVRVITKDPSQHPSPNIVLPSFKKSSAPFKKVYTAAQRPTPRMQSLLLKKPSIPFKKDRTIVELGDSATSKIQLHTIKFVPNPPEELITEIKLEDSSTPEIELNQITILSNPPELITEIKLEDSSTPEIDLNHITYLFNPPELNTKIQLEKPFSANVQRQKPKILPDPPDDQNTKRVPEPSIETAAELQLDKPPLLNFELSEKKEWLKITRKLNLNSSNGAVTKFKCPICQIMKTKPRLLIHYKKVHKLKMKTIMKRFPTKERFQQWKKKIETESNMSFVKKYIPKSDHKTDKSEEYICQRNVLFKLGKTKKMLKFVGINKIDGYCPAKMVTYIQPDGRLTVLYTVSHLGHDCEKPADRSEQEKDDKKLKFDEIQAEALNEDNDDGISLADESNNTNQETVPEIDLIAEKEKIKTELYRIIGYIDELKSYANVKVISEMLAPVISDICKWRETVHVPQVLVPLFQKELSSKLEDSSDSRKQSPTLNHLPGEKDMEKLANTGQSLEDISGIPIVFIDGQLNNDSVLSDNLPIETLHMEVEHQEILHDPAPVVKPLLEQFTVPSFTLNKNSAELKNNDPVLLDSLPIETLHMEVQHQECLPYPAPVVKNIITLNKNLTEFKHDKRKTFSLLKPIKVECKVSDIQQCSSNNIHKDKSRNMVVITKKNWPKLLPGTSLMLDVTKNDETPKIIKLSSHISVPGVQIKEKSSLFPESMQVTSNNMKRFSSSSNVTSPKEKIKFFEVKYTPKPTNSSALLKKDFNPIVIPTPKPPAPIRKISLLKNKLD